MIANPSTTSPRIRIASWCALILYLIVLAFLSLLPSGETSWAGGWDTSLSPKLQNLLHIPAYTVLTAIALWTAYVSGRLAAPTIFVVSSSAVLYGVLMEWLQAVAIPGRTGCLSDALLNALGVIISLAIIFPVRHFAQAADQQPLPPGEVAHH